MSETAVPRQVTDTGNDSAAIYQALAYQEMFNGSLTKAEAHANHAFILSQDSISECNALSILCYIYYRKGRQKDLELLMQTVSPEMYVNVMDVQSQVEQNKAGRQQLIYTIVITLLLLLIGVLGLWYYRHMKSLTHLYQQRIDTVRQKLRRLSSASWNTTGRATVRKPALSAVRNRPSVAQRAGSIRKSI